MKKEEQRNEKLYRVECICDNVIDGKKCGEFLMGSNEKPHLTAEELHKKWSGMVLSAPLNAPRCPKCKSDNTALREDDSDNWADLCLLCFSCGYDEREQKRKISKPKD